MLFDFDNVGCATLDVYDQPQILQRVQEERRTTEQVLPRQWNKVFSSSNVPKLEAIESDLVRGEVDETVVEEAFENLVKKRMIVVIN